MRVSSRFVSAPRVHRWIQNEVTALLYIFSCSTYLINYPLLCKAKLQYGRFNFNDQRQHFCGIKHCDFRSTKICAFCEKNSFSRLENCLLHFTMTIMLRVGFLYVEIFFISSFLMRYELIFS